MHFERIRKCAYHSIEFQMVHFLLNDFEWMMNWNHTTSLQSRQPFTTMCHVVDYSISDKYTSIRFQCCPLFFSTFIVKFANWEANCIQFKLKLMKCIHGNRNQIFTNSNSINESSQFECMHAVVMNISWQNQSICEIKDSNLHWNE